MAIDLRWDSKPFQTLTGSEVYAIAALRARVFVVEQNCVYADLDGERDFRSLHLLGWKGADLVAYLRVVPKGLRYPDVLSIGRVVSAPELRGRGLGRALMREGISRVFSASGPVPIRISAQAHLESFYASLGFAAVSGEKYLEDNILHLEMLRPGMPL